MTALVWLWPLILAVKILILLQCADRRHRKYVEQTGTLWTGTEQSQEESFVLCGPLDTINLALRCEHVCTQTWWHWPARVSPNASALTPYYHLFLLVVFCCLSSLTFTFSLHTCELRLLIISVDWSLAAASGSGSNGIGGNSGITIKDPATALLDTVIICLWCTNRLLNSFCSGCGFVWWVSMTLFACETNKNLEKSEQKSHFLQ